VVAKRAAKQEQARKLKRYWPQKGQKVGGKNSNGSPGTNSGKLTA
jgi:hypothetical protein